MGSWVFKDPEKTDVKDQIYYSLLLRQISEFIRMTCKVL